MAVNDLLSVYLFSLVRAVKLHIEQHCFLTVFGCQNVTGYASALTTTQETRLQGLAAASDCGTLWTFLLTFAPFCVVGGIRNTSLMIFIDLETGI